MHPVHTFTLYFPNIHSNIQSDLRLGLPNGFFPSHFLTKILYAFLISVTCAKILTYSMV